MLPQLTWTLPTLPATYWDVQGDPATKEAFSGLTAVTFKLFEYINV